MITVKEAYSCFLDNSFNLKNEDVPLEESLGRVLQKNVCARRDGPPFHRVAMDGIAIKLSDFNSGLRQFKIIGIQAAGGPQKNLTGEGTCLEVMTGAILPSGADGVIPYEELSIENNMATLSMEVKFQHYSNVHTRGADYKEGDTLIEAPCRIGSSEMAVLATEGYEKVEVSCFPKIALATTGDELVGVNEIPEIHQIVRSNPYALKSELNLFGYDVKTSVHYKDDEAQMRNGLRKLLDDHDVVILSGGVSKGKFDFVPKILKELGVVEVFHKVQQKPGKPLFFGKTSLGKWVVGLPGNPVSCMVNLRRYVVGALDALTGVKPKTIFKIQIAEDKTFKKDFTFFLPVKLVQNCENIIEASVLKTNGSGDLNSLVGSDGLLEIDTQESGLKISKGQFFNFYPWGQR